MIKIDSLSYLYKVKESNNLLSFKSSQLVALNNISLNIPSGQRHAIVGFNGAGKSTLIKLMIGILKPSSGSIYVNDNVPWTTRCKNVKNIGVVWGQRSTLWWDLPVIESFKTLRKIYGVSENNFKSKLDYLDKILNLNSYWNQPVRKLSLGQRTKAEITAALLHSPKLLILDEPFLGLDFISRRNILNILNDMIANDKITLVLTSHNLEDINELCDNITILEKGEVKFNDSIAEMKNKSSLFTEIILEKNDLSPLKLKDCFRKHNEIIIKKSANISNKYSIQYPKYKINTKDLMINILEENKNILDITIQEDSLETTLSKILSKVK